MYDIVMEARITSSSSTSEQREPDFLLVTLMVNNVNDNEPVFTLMDKQVFSERTEIGTSLFRVEATD